MSRLAECMGWVEKFCPRQDDKAISWRGSECLTSSPLRADRHPSFSVDVERGTWHDFATKEGGRLALLAKDIDADPWPGDEASAKGKSSRPVKEGTAARMKGTEEARALWEGASPAPASHLYLKARGITSLDLRVDADGWLLVPGFDDKGRLQAVQRIDKNPGRPGEKWAKRNVGPIGGAVWPVGDKKPGPVVICEGPATAATVRLLFEEGTVFCAFGSENVPTVAAKALGEEAPEVILAVDADDAGRRAAQEAPGGCIKCLPPKEGADWNDYARLKGLDAAKEAFSRAVRKARLLRDVTATPAGSRAKTVSARDLMNETFEPIQWTIDQLIPPGLTALAAPPKKGKSWLILQAALAVAGGESFLGHRTRRGPVLYCALEDSLARLQGRMGLLLRGNEPPEGLSLQIDLPRLDAGGLEWLAEWIIDNQPRMVILDTWQKVKGSPQKGLNAYESDYQAVGPLKALADKTGTAIVLVHHLKKGASRDGSEDIESLSGSMGLPGAADALLFLKRGEGADAATLARQGRDLAEDGDISLAWTAPGWRVATAEETREAVLEAASPTAQKILEALREEGTPCSASVLAALSGAKEPTVRKELSRLVSRGLLTRVGSGKYDLPDSREEENLALSGPDVPSKEKEKNDDSSLFLASLASRASRASLASLASIKHELSDAHEVRQSEARCGKACLTVEASDCKGSRPFEANEASEATPAPQKSAAATTPSVQSIAARAGCSEAAVRLALEEYPDRLRADEQGRISFLRGKARPADRTGRGVAPKAPAQIALDLGEGVSL